MTEAQLRRCPFCGAKARRWYDGDYVIVECRSCSAEVADQIEKKAVAAWNRRTPTPEA